MRKTQYDGIECDEVLVVTIYGDEPVDGEFKDIFGVFGSVDAIDRTLRLRFPDVDIERYDYASPYEGEEGSTSWSWTEWVDSRYGDDEKEPWCYHVRFERMPVLE